MPARAPAPARSPSSPRAAWPCRTGADRTGTRAGGPMAPRLRSRRAFEIRCSAGALAVAALAPAEQQHVRGHLSAEAVPDRPLHERGELGIVTEDTVEEGLPDRRDRPDRRRRHGRAPGDETGTAGGAKFSGAEVDRAGGRAEQERVCIPLVDSRDEVLIAT